MIRAAIVNEYLFTREQVTRLSKEIAKWKARADEIEKQLIAGVKAKQRVEAICPWRLIVEPYEKRFQPPYKQCAIELSSESKVLAWVEQHDPHEQAERLVLEVKPEIAKSA